MGEIKEICLIEDEDIQRFLTKKFIEKTGLVSCVSEFTNGKEAFDALKKRCESGKLMPNIIMLDINMPVWDGWEFYEAFINMVKCSHVKTYILTSSLSEEDYQTAVKFGLDQSYLYKPISFGTLLELLQNYQKEARSMSF